MDEGNLESPVPVNILLVDDNDTVRLIMKIALSVESNVGDVQEAADGVEAVAKCSWFQPDVVLLDYWMPRMDGAEAAAKIRELHPNVRIVAYSSVLDGKPDWADEYFPKDDIPDPEYVISLGEG